MTLKEPKIKDLTESEKEVLRLITEEFLSLKQIIIRRQTSRQAVYKIIKKLKEKGALNNGLQMVDKIEALPVNQDINYKQVVNNNYLRLHGQEFNIKILFQTPFYQKTLKKSNILFIEGHTIKLYNNSIEIYAGEGISFYGETTNNALHKSLIYWQKFITRLEHDLNCILIKPRVRNIRLVNQHWARGNSEIYENANNNNERIMIYAQEDGKLCFITDNSFNFKEDETLHPITAKQDREAIDKQINDWRLNNPPTNSELATYTKLNAQNLDHYAKHLSAHVESIKILGQQMTNFVNHIEKLTNIIEELKNKKI